MSDIVEGQYLQSDGTRTMAGLTMEDTFVEGPFGEFEIDVSISRLVWIWAAGCGGEDEIGWVVG